MTRLALVLIGLAVVWTQPLNAQTPDELRSDTVVASAERAALTWLAEVDSARWNATLERMVAELRSNVTVEQWRATVRGARAHLEPLGTRTLAGVGHGHSMFSAALTLAFRVVSETGVQALEHVTLVREGSDWLIGGYGIRK